MRTMFMTVVGVGLLAGLAALVGCQAQREVAADKIKDSIDGLLGKLDVKQKEVEIQLRALEQGINDIREAKVAQKVRLDAIDRELEPIQKNQTVVKENLTKIQTALKAGTSVDLGGKSYSIDELNKAGKILIDKYKSLEADAKTALAIKPTYEKRMAQLEEKQINYTKQMAELNQTLKRIKADMISAKAYQKASAAMGSVDDSLAQNVEKLKANLNDLDAEVQTVILREDDKFNADAEKTKRTETDDLIDALKQPADVSAELDAILGGDKK